MGSRISDDYVSPAPGASFPVTGTITATVDETTLAKDATLTGGTQKTQVVNGANTMPAGDDKTRAIFHQISDGTNGPVAIETAGADSVSNTANALVVKARLKGYNNTSWDRIRSGITACTATLTGWLNTMPWAIYNATPTTRTEGQGGPLQTATDGSLKTNIVNGANTMPAGDDKTRAIFHQISDNTNGPVAVETAGADGVSNTANALVVKSRLKGYNGTTWDRIRSGLTDRKSVV